MRRDVFASAACVTVCRRPRNKLLGRTRVYFYNTSHQALWLRTLGGAAEEVVDTLLGHRLLLVDCDSALEARLLLGPLQCGDISLDFGFV